MSNIEKIDMLLQNLLQDSNAFDGVAIIDDDGIIISSVLPDDVEEERAASMCLSLYRVGQTAAEELKRGRLEQIYIKGQNGYLMFHRIDEELTLVSVLNVHALLGTALNEIKQFIEQLVSLAQEGD